VSANNLRYLFREAVIVVKMRHHNPNQVFGLSHGLGVTTRVNQKALTLAFNFKAGMTVFGDFHGSSFKNSLSLWLSFERSGQ
jgi:hypothetical protein